MKIVIIGAGAMGCLYGAYLSRHNEVIMLDSYQPQVDAIIRMELQCQKRMEQSSISHQFVPAYLVSTRKMQIL